MKENLEAAVREACLAVGSDPGRLMDIVRGVQERCGSVPSEAMNAIAKAVGCHRIEVESVVTFYAFYSTQPKGKVVIRLCNDVVDKLKGYDAVKSSIEHELGITMGGTTGDGLITLEHTPCIGMCDQAPAALVNDVVVTNLTVGSVREMVRALRKNPDPKALVTKKGDGRNADPLIGAMVTNNLLEKGAVIFGSDHVDGAGLKKALGLSPDDLLKMIKDSRLRGRGGAGFPTGMKWAFTRGAKGDRKWILCNADEGEPGTFKDRVILTETPDLVFEGMTVGGYAIGAREGILYLRGEYAYLVTYLEKVLADRRAKGLLGKNAGGKQGFDFDIRIQLGAGAYICGEETSLISSCEGTRGDPKNRPPFPAQKGYKGEPTTVNNVETFCCVTRLVEKGLEWFQALGTKDSTGTKLLSVSGDVMRPGVYELPFGITMEELAKKVGATDANFAIIGGPSGSMIPAKDFGRKIGFDDLATGGAVLFFNRGRDPLRVASEYLDFFIEESCGYCTPCRVGNVLLKERLDAIASGHGEPADLTYLDELGATTKNASRCGLGQTSPNPVLQLLKNFRPLLDAKVKKNTDGFVKTFDIRAAVSDAEKIAGRESVHAD